METEVLLPQQKPDDTIEIDLDLDDGVIAFTVAVELSYLTEDEQYELHLVMDWSMSNRTIIRILFIRARPPFICMVLSTENTVIFVSLFLPGIMQHMAYMKALQKLEAMESIVED